MDRSLIAAIRFTGLRFTEKEKEATMPLVHKLLGLSIAARERGLLALVYEADKVTDDVLQKGLQMIVNGDHSDEVERALSAIIEERVMQDVVTVSERTMVVNLLGGCITMRGILLIQSGAPTHRTAFELLSLLEGESEPGHNNSGLPADLRLENITAVAEEIYEKKSFRATCLNCKTINEITVLLDRTGFNEWYDFHCAHCGLKVQEVLAAIAPQVKIGEDEV